MRTYDPSNMPAWQKLSQRYSDLTIFGIDADPALMSIEADGRFSAHARVYFSFGRTNTLGIPVDASGNAGAQIEGKVGADGALAIERFDILAD